MSVEAQLKCDCGERDLVVTWTDSAEVGERTDVKMPCSGCGSLERTVTVVYNPEEYDLADPYGEGVTLRARCIDCGSTYYGPIEECYECDGVRFDRFLEGSDEE